MRSTMTIRLGAFAVAAGSLALCRGELTASGSIDTTGATTIAGSAPSQGTVTIDEAADLGAQPTSEFDPVAADDPTAFPYDVSKHLGLGGPNFHPAHDVSFVPGTYDFGSFTVDQGITVTFQSPTLLRVTKDVHVEGRIDVVPSGTLTQGVPDLAIDCSGDFIVVGRSGSVATGLFLTDAPNNYISVGGLVDVSADTGAKAHFESVSGFCQLGISADGGGLSTLSDATFTLASANVNVAGDLEATDVEMHLGSARVGGLWAPNGAIAIHGGTYAGLTAWAHDDIDVTDAAGEAGVRFAELTSAHGAIRLHGTTAIVADQAASLSASGDIEIGGHSAVRATNADPQYGGTVGIVSSGGDVTVSEDATVELVGGSSLSIDAGGSVEVSGTVTGGGAWNELAAMGGDVTLKSGANVAGANGYLRLWAAGAVTAEGGSAVVSAREYDIVATTGDVDLDLATMTATAGRLVALAKGSVRLRGIFQSANDMQIISLGDAIDVHGASLSTADAGSSLSGFVRLATYSSNATIDATDATLRSGASDAQSGDVLLQVAKAGAASKSAGLHVARVQSRRTADGVVTRIHGTIAGTKKPRLAGSGRITAGSVSRRLFLHGRKGRLTDTSDAMDIVVSGTAFTLTVREPAVNPGEQAPLRLDRAGLHAQGKFRRPKVK